MTTTNNVMIPALRRVGSYRHTPTHGIRSSRTTSPATSVTTPVTEAARVLGRLGGLRNTPAQARARAANGQFGGRPRRYQVQMASDQGTLKVLIREKGAYPVARSLDAAALIFLGRWLSANAPGLRVANLDGGDVRLTDV